MALPNQPPTADRAASPLPRRWPLAARVVAVAFLLAIGLLAYPPVVAASGRAPALLLAAAAMLAGWLAAVYRSRLRTSVDAISGLLVALTLGEKRRLGGSTQPELGAVATLWNAMLDAVERSERDQRAWTEELEVLIGSIQSVVFAVSPAGDKVLFASAQTREIYGVPPEAFLASPTLWRDLIHPVDRRAVAALMRQLRRSGRYDVEYRIRRGDGATRWVRHRGILLCDESGNRLRITGVVTDISRRRERELRLEASERRIGGLIRASLDGIVSVDETGCVVLYNPAAERMFGRPPAAVVGMPIKLLFAPARCPQLLSTVATLQGGGGAPSAPQVVCGLRADGSEFTIEATVARHAVGEHGFVTVMLRDISARVAAETRVQQLSLAVEQSPVSIQITDTDLRIDYVNKHFGEATGYAREDLVGESMDRFVASPNWPDERRRLREIVAGGGEWCGEIRCRRKDGSLIWAFARVTPMTGGDGAITHFLAILEDVTEKKIKDERERRRQEQLAHSARLILLGEMASSVAHELNQPLTAIGGFGSACARLVGDRPEALALLKKIDAQVVRAGEIVWRTRDFARRQGSREPLDIAELVLGVADWMAAEARRHEIVLDTTADGGLPPVRGDRLQIEQVLLNLVQNAFEAVREIATPRRVVIAALPASDGGIVVSVEDSGCGVPEQVALDVFQPFFTTKSTGLGLGLAISSSIVADHGGRLWHAPVAGGTSFRFSLPAAPL